MNQELKKWNKTWPISNLREKEDELKSIQAQIQSMPMDTGLIDKELRLQEEVTKLSFQEKIQLQQRAKCTWLKYGDRCSNFFSCYCLRSVTQEFRGLSPIHRRKACFG
ncbi:uncharacterized protein M6B38_401445 [Iris pallida]|uniref:Uncharacterized protein n=1 Tax=Iris pallida TaxID=29817 RepID=A0AAX6FTV0_IRIPA|nr:uncharacterized protein M6B38_401445 [Iris pallida]